MHIQVLFAEVSYDDVCNDYNNHKPDNWNPLQRLERAEGGFSIDITSPEHTQSVDPNARIKQLRWKNKYLHTPRGWIGFNDEELALLYQSICNVYGNTQVLLLHDELNSTNFSKQQSQKNHKKIT